MILVANYLFGLLTSWAVLAVDTQEVIQAASPLRRDFSSPACQQTLMSHSFGNSYGAPFVSMYEPPENCVFTTVVFNLSVVSSGRQYDRLAFLYFDDVEVWRTSTAMPTRSRITWTFSKDVTVFDTILRRKRKIIFDLGNIVDGKLYTGYFNITLEASYFNDRFELGLRPAQFILPLSTCSSPKNTTSVFSLPGDAATVNITMPRNATTAIVSVLASGNGDEEFWYTNVPTGYTQTFPGNEGWLYGYSPFREVQVLIDGQLAGVSWPFPLLFTGGVDPGAWRPIVGIDAFDLPSTEIDITPWLGLLCDDLDHTVQFRIIGYDPSAPDGIGPVGDNWWVSGSIFVWVDERVRHELPTKPVIDAPKPEFNFVPKLATRVSTDGSIMNSSLHLELTASRKLTVSSSITTGGKTTLVTWQQELFFENLQNMTDPAFNQSLSMFTEGSHSSVAGHLGYQYPINLFSAYNVSPTNATTSPGSVFCIVDRSKLTDGVPMLPFLTGLTLGREEFATRQRVVSDYHWNETIVEGIDNLDTSDGETWLSLAASPGNSNGVSNFSQHASERNGQLTADTLTSITVLVPSTQPLPYVDGMPVV